MEQRLLNEMRMMDAENKGLFESVLFVLEQQNKRIADLEDAFKNSQCIYRKSQDRKLKDKRVNKGGVL